MRHAVIMAGGVGSRLWPMSREASPKQFQKLLGDKTLIQQTFDRIVKLIPAEQIWVMTGEQYIETVQQQLPNVPAKNIIAEPMGRNTTAATGLALLTILKEDPEAVLFGLLPADHYVGKEDVFLKATESALQFIEKNPEYVVTIGIRPDEPNTGLGYIQLGDGLGTSAARSVFKVGQFIAKPTTQEAQNYVESGRYLWNGGYYLFNAQTMRQNFAALVPDLLKSLEEYLRNPSTDIYEKIESVQLDKAISERLEKLAVIPAEMEWSDIGNWATLHSILASQGKTTEVVVGEHMGENSHNSLVMGGSKLIVTVGVKDIVVIDTDDVILVCDKGSVQDVKKIVEKLEEENKTQYL